jgi:hypothetical protein
MNFDGGPTRPISWKSSVNLSAATSLCAAPQTSYAQALGSGLPQDLKLRRAGRFSQAELETLQDGFG